MAKEMERQNMSAPLCTACGLPTNVPAHLPPADALGVCAACVALRSGGMLERLALNDMPACFVPTRESYVRLAALALLMRGMLRGVTERLATVDGESAGLVAEARALAGKPRQ
jgi:hypothetical protein